MIESYVNQSEFGFEKSDRNCADSVELSDSFNDFDRL